MWVCCGCVSVCVVVCLQAYVSVLKCLCVFVFVCLHESVCVLVLVLFLREFVFMSQCGSKIGTQHRTLVNGNMDYHLRFPGGLILTHTHVGLSLHLRLRW